MKRSSFSVPVSFVLALLVLLMAACGQNAGSGSQETARPTVQPTAQTSTEPAAASKEPATLKFWYPGAGEAITAVIEGVIDRFEAQYPHVTVELTLIPWAEYFQKVTVAYAGGLQPDVHGLGYGQLISTVDQGKYLDLQPYITAENWEGQSDFFPDILKSGQYQGGQYGLLQPEVRPLAWRKDFLREANLDPESPPQTVDELFAMAEKLKVVEGGQTVRGGIDIQTANGEQSYLSLLLLFGEDFYDDDGNPTFDSATSIALVERLVELYQSGAIMAAHQQQAGGTPFVNSQAALAFISTAGASSLIEAVGGENIGWTLPPAGPDGNRTALILGTFLTAAKDSKHPQEAWDFIKFWFDRDNIFDFASKTGFVPPRQSLHDEFIQLSAENAVSFEALKQAQGYRASELWAINVKYLRLALEESYNGIKPVAAALQDNAKLAKEEIAGLKR